MDCNPSTSFSDFNFLGEKLCSTWEAKVSFMSFVCLGNIFTHQKSPSLVRVTCKSHLMTRCISDMYSHKALLYSYYKHGLNYFLAPAFPEAVWSTVWVIVTCQEKAWMNYKVKTVNFGQNLQRQITQKVNKRRSWISLADHGINRIDNAESLIYF